MKFNTVLYNLRSAKNIGMIARSHIAFGGGFLIIIEPEERHKFKGGTHTYTRKLDDLGKLLTFPNEEQFLAWSSRLGFNNVAVEIGENSTSLVGFGFPDKCNLIFGNENKGLPVEFLEKIENKVTIPQFGEVSSLNVAVSASIVYYEMKRSKESEAKVSEAKFTVK